MKKSLKSFYSIDEQQRVDIINTMKTVLPDICMANNINIDSKLGVKEQKMELPLNDFETTVKFYQDIDESKKRDDYVHDIK